VEWAFTVFGIIQGLYDLSTDERTQIVYGLCGSPSELDVQLDWSKEYTELSDISTDIDLLRWLVLGLDDSSSVRITDLLEEIRESQLEEPSVSDDPDTSPIEPPRLTLPQPNGVLILRFLDVNNECWTYHIVDRTEHWSITDLRHESELLTDIISDCQIPSSVPTALLCLEQDVPSVTSHNTTTHSKSYTQQYGWHQHFEQSIQVDTPGEFNTQKPTSSTRFKCAWQHIGQWKYTLKTIQGPDYPMVWNLQRLIHQTATGSGGSSGHIQVRSSVFTQILGDDQRLSGTSSTDDTLPFPEEMEQRADSQHCIWQLPYSALDFKDHASHFNLDVEPLFNTAITLNQGIDHLQYIRGSGCTLHGQQFVEMMLQATQSDSSRRTEINIESRTNIQVTGDITWCGHQLCSTVESDGFSWIWTHNETNRIFK
jgi:hypothetical protein